MHESQEPFFEEEGLYEAINKFEEMQKCNDTYYFDVYEFETIIDYYLDQHKLSTAVEAIDIGLLQHPQSSTLKFRLAQAYIQGGKPAKGLRLLRSIEFLETGNVDFYLLKGSALNLLGKKEEADEAFNCAVENATEGKDDVLYNIAFSYVNTRRYKSAIHYLLIGHEVNPENPTILHELALAYERLDDLENSVVFYKKYLDFDPFSDSIWMNLGLVYSSLKKYDEALEAYDFSLAIYPDNISVLFSKANLLVSAGKYREAIKVYEETIRLEPANVQAYVYIGECYEKLDYNKRAIFFYKKALSIELNNNEAWYGLGMANYQLEHYTEALTCLKKASEIDPENADNWFMLGEVNRKLSDYKEAVYAYNRAVELDPTDYEAWINKAELSFHEFSNVKEAIKILNEAYQYNQNNSALNYKLAFFYLHNNQSKLACRFFEKALSINFQEHQEYLAKIPASRKGKDLRDLIEKYKN